MAASGVAKCCGASSIGVATVVDVAVVDVVDTVEVAVVEVVLVDADNGWETAAAEPHAVNNAATITNARFIARSDCRRVPRVTSDRASSAEEILFGFADDLVADVAAAQPLARDAPHDRDRDPGRLAHDELSGGGELVDDRDLRDLHL